MSHNADIPGPLDSPDRAPAPLPLISVCVPAFKAEQFIHETLNSIRLQSFGDWELIVTEDGSDDRTRHIVSKFAATVTQDVRYQRHDMNKGLPATRNTGISAARGEWIALLDSDDLWSSDHLEEAVKLVRGGRADIIHGGSILFESESGERIGVRAPSSEIIRAFPRSLFCGDYIIQPSSVVIRRSSGTGWATSTVVVPLRGGQGNVAQVRAGEGDVRLHGGEHVLLPQARRRADEARCRDGGRERRGLREEFRLGRASPVAAPAQRRAGLALGRAHCHASGSPVGPTLFCTRPPPPARCSHDARLPPRGGGLQRGEEGDMNAVCTLFEGHYHLGAGALVNSLHASGFTGRIVCGHRGSLPAWGEAAQRIRGDFEVRFVRLETQSHLTYHKPEFMLRCWSEYCPGASQLHYLDPDIVVKAPWATMGAGHRTASR